MDDESRSRLSAILKNVITTEINLRTADLTATEQNINTVREYLNRTRLGVCADFYDDNFKTTLQKPSHRAVKKTFAGKAPIKQEPPDYDLNALSSTSQWNSEAQQVYNDTINYKDLTTVKEESPDLGNLEGIKQENVGDDEDKQQKYLDPDEKLAQISDEKRRPRYIPPVIPVTKIQHSLKPRGDKNMKKIRFLVRNNSKYISTPEDSSGATHKWSLNLNLNDESMDISQIVSKVVFYLHPSYKPHDVVTVTSAPFKITRRGWGEFDMRIKIFFVNEKDEPVAVNHQLVFDKLHSGMETFGGETIFDHWINEPSETLFVGSVDTIAPSKDNETYSYKVDQPIPTAVTSIPTLSTTTFDDLSSLPFNNETSKHFLSAIFGETEELSTAKKDWEQFDNLFNLDDLAFPEFFGFGINDPKLSNTNKSGDRVSQLNLPKVNAVPGNLTDVSLEEKCSPIQAISDVASLAADVEVSTAKHECSDRVNSLVTDQVKIEPLCENDPENTFESASPINKVPSAVTTHVTVCSDQRSDFPGSVENITQELYLSDLSEFGDEVIIMDSNDSGMNQSLDQPKDVAEEQSLPHEKHLPDCGRVDYGSMEMDDLIKFPSGKLSSSGVELQQGFVSSRTSSSVSVVASSKSSAANPKRRSNAVVKPASQKALKTSVKLVTKPNPPLLSSPGNLLAVMSTKQVVNSPPATLYVSSSNLPSIITPKNVSQNTPTLLVSSPNRSPITSPKCRTTSSETCQKTSAKNSNRTIVKKVVAPRKSITSVISSANSISKGGSNASQVHSPSTSRTLLQGSLVTPLKSVVTSANPITITTGGQPITLLSVINTSSVNTIVNKTSPIVISSPKVGSQTTPTLLVPSSMILKPALNKTVNIVNNTVGQINNTIFPQAIPLAPKTKGSKLVGNVMKMSPSQVGIRPGSTRYLVKLPDGTLKPINLESLTPLKPPELRITNPVASSSRPHLLMPQPVLVRSPVAPTVVSAAMQPTALRGIAPRGKRSAPPNIMSAKRRKTEPKAAIASGNVRAQRSPIILSPAPQVVFKLPESSKQLLVVPQAANQPVIRLQSHQRKTHSNPPLILKDKVSSPTQTAVSICQKPAVNSDLPSNLILKPEGMNILKRRPPETEVDARSLVEDCPKCSTEVSICWLLKRFPLVNSRAGEESFKQAFPYCALNPTQFNQWPIAKRRAHELLRAIDVLRLIKQIHPGCRWKKLDVVKFARLRGFTPLMGKLDPSMHVHKPPPIKDRCTITDLDMLTKIMASYEMVEDNIDVMTIEEDKLRSKVLPSTLPVERKGKVFMTLQGVLEDATFVEKWVERVSIYLEPEEIEPGVKFPAALRVLISAFHSFAEDLVRRSYSSSFLRHNSKEPRIIAPEDVNFAIFSRQEFDLFTKQGFGTSRANANKPLLEIKESPEEST